MNVREMTYLITARTTAHEGVPVFWTRRREVALSKAFNVTPGCVNDASRRQQLPVGQLIDVSVIELIDGWPARATRVTPLGMVKANKPGALPNGSSAGPGDGPAEIVSGGPNQPGLLSMVR